MAQLNRRQLLGSAALAAAAVPLTAGAARAATPGAPDATNFPRRPVTTGAQRQADAGWSALSGERVGVISNPTGVLDDLTHIVDQMVASGGADVVAVFGPEHGFRGTSQAGDSQDTYVDPRTGVTVYDAYGATAEKFARFFREAEVDTVVFDIQDVGARFYTYIWTMYTAMVAAAQEGKRFVVLDRPNPIGGYARGPMLQPDYESGVGKKPIVQQHGMTVGELARYFDGELLAEDAGRRLTDLTVVKVSGWRRDVPAVGTDVPWVMPSPNMPTPDTALVYPGTCLFEATNLSEGRGTTRPFELVAAPYVDYRWAEALRQKDIPGVEFREAYYTPTFSKHAGVACGGVQVHITDPARVEAILAATHMMVEAHRLYTDFDWRGDAGRWIGLLTGSSRFGDMLMAGASAEQIVDSWRDELAEWNVRREPYLLYAGPQR
ncbi:MAG TPA: DUF1343 domain-containing protein [Segeticoccus sp.]|uniref:exo-beta-N-acetylmuramidase NamZ family protein n=1 Tax=Segeticoccus sp. TaxID=2706531 RepID=UPI002D802DCF|nr:DUF1343 domain-containing protein [Segeticoccus sp.]HET8601303.1 DUF1343 domain-containing protein [Segeticoccus sp.]